MAGKQAKPQHGTWQVCLGMNVPICQLMGIGIAVVVLTMMAMIAVNAVAFILVLKISNGM
jgi:hypothetical protein